MRVTVYDAHPAQKPGSAESMSMVLGVHSFSKFLQELPRRSKFRILVQGDYVQIMQNILWNQFYSFTLLRDLHKVLCSQVQSTNCFFRIQGRALRLAQCLDWARLRDLEMELLKSPSCLVQGFTEDGAIKTIWIDLGQANSSTYDLIFKYEPVQKSSLNSTQKHRKQILSNLQKENCLDKTSVKFATKSLFERTDSKKDQPARHKVETERKYNKTSNKNGRQSIPKLAASGKISKCATSNKQNQSLIGFSQCLGKSRAEAPSNPIAAQSTQSLGRQEMMAKLLAKKECSINQYRQKVVQLQTQHQRELDELQQRHEEQMKAIRKQIEDVLAGYKSKNKELKRENNCLESVNEKLSIANNRLEEKARNLEQLVNKLTAAGDGADKQLSDALRRAEQLETQNRRLAQKLSSQSSEFGEQMEQKNKSLAEVQARYNQLVKNLMATVSTEAANF